MNVEEIEERLFILLDTVEKSAELSEESRKENSKILEVVKQQLVVMAEKNEEFDDYFANQIEEIDMSQKRFDDIVYQANYNNVDETLTSKIYGKVSLAFNQAVENSEGKITNAVDEEVSKITSDMEKLNKAMLSNLEVASRVAVALTRQHDLLVKKHYTVIGVIAIGLFAAMLAVYSMTVPTQSQLQKLKEEKAGLQQDISMLKKIKQESSKIDYGKIQKRQ